VQEQHFVEVGIDEAGRGPFIGDMVVAGVIGLDTVFRSLESIGVRDSKMLSPGKRRILLEHILYSDIDIVAVYVPPYLIDVNNLNKLECTTICSILNYLSHSRILRQKPLGIRIYIDEVKGCLSKVMDCARNIYGGDSEVFMEPDADKKYPAVSTASIVAKVYRDTVITAIGMHGGNIGSGYPSDPVSRMWLTKAYSSLDSPPAYLRRSWGIIRDIAPKWYISKKTVEGKKGRSILDYAKKG